jgi:hypothetical protein
MLFLGAGASVPFGYPPTKPFVSRLLEQTPESMREGLLLRAICNAKGVEDAEHIIEILDTIAGLKDSLARTFFENTTLSTPPVGNLRYGELEELAVSLRGRIIREIFRTYSWKGGSKERFEIYSRLFNIIREASHNEFLCVFTTNYDRVIEEFCLDEQIPFEDGFVHDPRRRIWEWNPPEREAKRPLTVYLYKLHGSLNWRRTIDGRIEQVRPEEPIGVGGEDSFLENVLIYPGEKVQPTSQPFRHMYEAFSREIREVTVCIVIGFSFRDQYLNVGFSEFLEREHTKLMVISPNAADNIRTNLARNTDILKRIREPRLVAINQPLEPLALRELTELLHK